MKTNLLLKQGKKAQIEDLVEFAIAAILMGVLILVITVLLSLPNGLLGLKGKVMGTVEDFTTSKACDYYLMNLLRTENGNVSFAETAAYTKINSDYIDIFKANVTKFLDNNYKRGDNEPGGIWQVSLSSGLTNPYVVFGNLTATNALDTCSKTIPSITGGAPIIVRLALQY